MSIEVSRCLISGQLRAHARSERAELDSNDVELLKAIFDKLTASYT